MKEKIKIISLIIFYIFIWVVFIFSLLGIIFGLSDIENIKKWWMFLLVVILSFSCAYLLRRHIRILKDKTVFLIKWILNKKIILIILLIIGGLFYWFQWRPNDVRKKCALESYYSLRFDLFQTNSQKDQSYKECLRINGLEK